MVDPFPDEPSHFATSRDGTRIAVFEGGLRDAPPVLLVHGTSADHLTWRTIGPTLAARTRIAALDRRGRGASGDAPAYTMERELEDLAAVAGILAAEAGGPIDVVGHSLGGRIALAATRISPAIGRVVAYESAPGNDAAGDRYDEELIASLRERLDAGDLDGLLTAFMTEAVRMSKGDLEAFRANPIWARRAAAGPTIVRELEASLHDPVIGLDALAAVTVPVVQLMGSASAPWFRAGAIALHERLADGRLETIEGARHAAHSTHPAAFLAAVYRFLGA